jgi:MutS domain V
MGRKADALASGRLAVFLVSVLCAAWLFSVSRLAAVAAVALAASVTLFLVLVALHARARNAAAHARALHELNVRGSARVRREWSALPNAREVVPSDHPYATDLDVGGSPASLFRLLDVVSAATGRPTLLRWLLSPAPAAGELGDRQAAVIELAAATAFREELALLAQQGRDIQPEQFESLLQWAEGTDDVWAERSAGVLWVARLIPMVTLATAVLAFFRLLPWTAPGLCVLLGLVVLARYRAALSAGLTSVLAHATGLHVQRRMLEQITPQAFTAPLLQRLRERTAGGTEALRALERALGLIEGRGSLMHAIANILVLWDVHAMAWVERWRKRHGRRLREYLAALGDVESLAALGMLAHDNPRWNFPTFDEKTDCLTANALGHPLLPAATRVANDVGVGPPGKLLLVTGSNMSGKSTLLRAIGLNVVLAQAGAPVCAERLGMPLVELRTSIRLADSLERGVSLFMAELERLKEIVDAARAGGRTRPLLYLLDEILHGTNTAERLIAARAVLSHLVRAGAIGAVTTHDLTLAADGALTTASRPVHFTEHVTSGDGDAASAMTFDYRLRPGLATSTNALKLLALVGLGDASRPPTPPTPTPG